MEFNKEGMLLVIVITCLLSTSGAAIEPVETSNTASDGDDVHLTWSYDDENEMFSVDWTFQSETAAIPESIMTQNSGSPAKAENNYNVEHSGNGNITLKSVTIESSGKYFCAVTYNLGSGLSPVTGTATLTVSEINDCPEFTAVHSQAKCISAWGLIGFAIVLVVLFSIGIVLGCILKGTTFCCDSFYNVESCKDCVNKYYRMCQCCDKTPCGAYCNIKGLPNWYQVLWASVVGSPVAFGVWLVWRCCNNAKCKLLRDEPHPENEGKKPRPSHSPPTGANINDSNLLDKHDRKGRYWSANLGDFYHPLVKVTYHSGGLVH